MSKKILKRSLALGALMVFVITGSAMAGDVNYEGSGVYTLNNADGSENVVLNVTKTDYYGVYLNSGQIDVGNLDITSNCGGMVVKGNPVTINANNITIVAYNNIAAIYNGDVVGAQLDINVTNDLNITGGTGQGIITGDMPKSVDIKAKNINMETWFQGIAGYGNVKLDAENITITSKEWSDYNAIETWATDASVELIAAKDINITGAVQGKANAGGQSEINLFAENVYITANKGEGEEASTDGVIRNVDINATGKVSIKATGNLSGVGAGSDDATRPHSENSIKAKEIEIVSEGSFGVYANNHGYYASGTKKHCNIEAETINITSKKDGILVMNGAEAEVKGFESLNITSEEQGIGSEYGDIVIEGGNLVVDSAEEGIRSKLGGELNIKTDLTKVEAGEGFESIKLTGDSELVINSSTTQLKGDITTETYEGKNASLKVNFDGEASYLTGKVLTVEGANTELTFNGGTWNVTGESNVSKIDGTEANIKVAELKEGLVTISDTEELVTLVVATENNGTNTEGDLNALATVVLNEKNEVIADQVQLKNAIYDNVVGNVTDEGVEIAEKEVASANVSVNDMVAVGMMSWRAEMNDMNKRMGELRNANGEHGVWVRMVRGESEYNSVKNQYNQYQLGYDEKLSVDKRWTVGVALSYTDAENNFAQGTGESTNKALSVYGSKLNDDGTFIDLIAKYARLENDFKTYSGMGDADYDANGYSVSAEFGKRIQQGKGLWIEPQFELTYGTVGSADYVTKNGVKVAQDSMDSFIARAGFALGKDIKDGNVYARASYLYDFDGETKAVLNGVEALENDLGGGWWEVGIGANLNLSKATYIYADIEKTFGGEVDTNWQWNLGVRYSF